MSNQRKAVVYKEHTLGLLWEYKNHKSISVFRGDIFKGAPKHQYMYDFSNLDFVKEEDYRQATLEDFQEFNVCYHENYLIA